MSLASGTIKKYGNAHSDKVIVAQHTGIALILRIELLLIGLNITIVGNGRSVRAQPSNSQRLQRTSLFCTDHHEKNFFGNKDSCFSSLFNEPKVFMPPSLFCAYFLLDAVFSEAVQNKTYTAERRLQIHHNVQSEIFRRILRL